MSLSRIRKFFVSLGIVFFLYITFYIIFFFFLASFSVDGLIGLSMFFLFAVIYRFGGTFINRYFLSISRNIWLYFASLIFLTYLIRKLFINISVSLKNIFVFQIFSNYYIFFELEKNISELNIILLKKFVLNSVLFELYYKRLVINNLLEKNVISNEISLFLVDFIDENVFFFYNTLGWLKY